MHQTPNKLSTKNALTIQTKTQNWVIPYNCELLKALLKHQKLNASDLCFDCESQCKLFVKNVFLLAAEDEASNQCPSVLAQLGREIIKQQQANPFH